MPAMLVSISTWLHAIATVVFTGHYLLLAGIYLPAMSRGDSVKEAGAILGEVSKRSRYWMYASLLVFFVTGMYLMLIDSGYLGFMNFGNLWGILMLVKHILILAMIGLGFWYNAILRVGPLMLSNNPEQAIPRFRSHVNVMAICSVLVLLLTAIAQAE